MHTGVFSSSGGCASAVHCAGSSAQTGHALFPSSPHRMSQMHDVSSNRSAANAPTAFVPSNATQSAALATLRQKSCLRLCDFIDIILIFPFLLLNISYIRAIIKKCTF